MPDPRPPELAEAERWFVDHGLPYFVDETRGRVRAGLSRSRLLMAGLVALLVGAAVGVGVGVWTSATTSRSGVSPGLVAGSQVVVLSALLYALTTLQAWSIARWALHRTQRSLRLLFPLVTRALPLLLLFVTFLFINAEVWEVAATLEGAVMWLTVLMFTGITVAFLLVRLPEELEVFDRDLEPARIVEGCRGTPMESFAREHAQADETERAADEDLAGLQKANLVLMLLIAQLVQVLLLSLAVFVFFIVFGLLIMDTEVIKGWTGETRLTAVPWLERANWQLMRVSIFLAAFSGLYFTVYAVTDEVYRTQFFTTIVKELQRAVSVRAAYRALVRRTGPGAAG